MKARWLFNKHPLVIDPEVATAIGLKEAVFLQQLNYWLHSNSAKKIHNRMWIYNTYENWKKDNFPFWSVMTIRRTLSSLKEKEIVITANFNRLGFDNTLWFSIDYEKLDEYMNRLSVQNEQTDCSKWTDASVQNEQTNTRDYTETTPENSKYSSSNDEQPSKSQKNKLSISELKASFEKLWKKYPKKRGKQRAFNSYKAFRKKSVKNTDDYLNHQLDLYLARIEREHIDPQYILNGSTWFGGRYEDEEETDAPKQQHGGFDSDLFVDEDNHTYDDDLPF